MFCFRGPPSVDLVIELRTSNRGMSVNLQERDLKPPFLVLRTSR